MTLDRADEFAADSRLYGASDVTETATYHMRPFGPPRYRSLFRRPKRLDAGERWSARVLRFCGRATHRVAWQRLAKRVKPIGMHLWGADPWARGSYSYAVPGRADDRARLAAPVDGRLFFAGEACSPDWFSTAQGAYRTGFDAAEAVLAARRGAASK